RERHPEKTEPRPTHVTAIETAHAVVAPLAHRRASQSIPITAYEMAQRVTAECVAAKQDHVECENQRTDSDAEMGCASRWIWKPHRDVRVVRKNGDEHERDVHEVAMHVLQNQREPPLAPIARARFANRAVGRIRPE